MTVRRLVATEQKRSSFVRLVRPYVNVLLNVVSFAYTEYHYTGNVRVTVNVDEKHNNRILPFICRRSA